MASFPGVRDTFFHETTTNVSMKSEEPTLQQTVINAVKVDMEKDERLEPLEARGEDVDIDLSATAHALYEDAGEHRRLSDIVLDTARRLSEPDAFDSLFT